MLEKVSDLAYAASKYLVLFLVGIMSIVIIIQVLCRTFLGFSIFWSEEFARYCLVWVTFIGTSMAVRNADLAKFDLVLEIIPEKWKRFYQIVLDLIIFTFLAVAFYYGIQQVLAPSSMVVSPALRLPMWVVYLSVPVGFFLMMIHVVNSLVKNIWKRKEDKEWQLS